LHGGASARLPLRWFIGARSGSSRRLLSSNEKRGPCRTYTGRSARIRLAAVITISSHVRRVGDGGKVQPSLRRAPGRQSSTARGMWKTGMKESGEGGRQQVSRDETADRPQKSEQLVSAGDVPRPRWPLTYTTRPSRSDSSTEPGEHGGFLRDAPLRHDLRFVSFTDGPGSTQAPVVSCRESSRPRAAPRVCDIGAILGMRR